MKIVKNYISTPLKLFTYVVPLSLIPYLSLVFFIFSETPLMNFLISWNHIKTTVSKDMVSILKSSTVSYLLKAPNIYNKLIMHNMERRTSKFRQTHTLEFSKPDPLSCSHKSVAVHEEYCPRWIRASFLSTHWQVKIPSLGWSYLPTHHLLKLI